MCVQNSGFGSCTGLWLAWVGRSLGSELRMLGWWISAVRSGPALWWWISFRTTRVWVTHSLYNSWCLVNRGVWYALLMRANKPEGNSCPELRTPFSLGTTWCITSCVLYSTVVLRLDSLLSLFPANIPSLLDPALMWSLKSLIHILSSVSAWPSLLPFLTPQRVSLCSW